MGVDSEAGQGQEDFIVKSKAITVNLMGGLGNQMFQYAAGRSLAQRNAARLYVDASSGFARDKVYKRTFELGALPIEARTADAFRRAPFWLSRLNDKFSGMQSSPIKKHVWGAFIRETAAQYLGDVAGFHDFANAWMYGYWQCEEYFSDIKPLLAKELAPPVPRQRQFVEMAQTIELSNSVAVGVRLFEEVPGATKAGVGGLTPIAFYNVAAKEMARSVKNPVFFVFCTTESPTLRQIEYPGPVHYITHDNGFEGSLARLWLISRCSHHILSNSSFYWWAAWLAEQRSPQAKIIASALFPNRDTIPKRWLAIAD